MWVLTNASQREALEGELERLEIGNIHLLVHDIPPLRWFLPRSGHHLGSRLHNVLWELTVPLVARRLHRRHRFDVLHKATTMSVELPGITWLLLRTPFVWGPVGGAQEAPAELRRYYDSRGWLSERLRAWRKRSLRFNPLVRAAARRAAAVIVVNSETERMFRRLGARELRQHLDIVVGPDDVRALASHQPREEAEPGGTFRVLWAGSLIGRKAPSLALDVFAALIARGVAARLAIVGDGPLRDAVAERVRELGLTESVELRGQVPHEELLEEYGRADAFLFTSVSDTSGAVILESMLNGLPVVALDHQGAAQVVTPESGTLVRVGEADAVVAGMTDALAALAADPGRRARMSEAAQRRAAEFDRDRCAALLDELYSRAAAGAHPT